MLWELSAFLGVFALLSLILHMDATASALGFGAVLLLALHWLFRPGVAGSRSTRAHMNWKKHGAIN